MSHFYLWEESNLLFSISGSVLWVWDTLDNSDRVCFGSEWDDQDEIQFYVFPFLSIHF